MKVEFPLKHIENNLIFNRNGDVWAYFKTDMLNLFLLNYQNKNIHIYTNSSFEENTFYVGFRLEMVVGSTSRFLVNVKSFFEGFSAQVNRSVGLETYSIIKDDIVDYSKKSQEIEHFLQKRMKVSPLQTKEILTFYNHLLYLNNTTADGFIELDQVSIESVESNVLRINNDSTEQPLYVQYLMVTKTESVETIVSLMELSFPVSISIRSDFNQGTSISVRVESNDSKELTKRIDGLYSYSDLLGIKLLSPLGEQFRLLYENVLGSNKLDSNYDIKTLLKNKTESEVKQ